jgi:hypothetical protein
MAQMTGEIEMTQVSDGGHPLFECYRDMAVANGVNPKNRLLTRCR